MNERYLKNATALDIATAPTRMLNAPPDWIADKPVGFSWWRIHWRWDQGNGIYNITAMVMVLVVKQTSDVWAIPMGSPFYEFPRRILIRNSPSAHPINRLT